MFIIDTHTHLYLEEFNSDIDVVMERAVNAGVKCFLLPNIDRFSLHAMTNLFTRFPKNFRLMFGLHPCSVKENWKEELNEIFLFAEKYSCVGMGEIGLDFYWDTTYRKEQMDALEYQLKYADEKKLPVSLHTRNAIDETIEMIHAFPCLKGVFHCFTGTIEQARRIIDFEDFYIGIGGVVTFKNSGLKEVLQQIPLEKIVVETDAPYLAPAPHRGKRNEPVYLTEIIRVLAAIYQKDLKDIIRQLYLNTTRVFSLDFQ